MIKKASLLLLLVSFAVIAAAKSDDGGSNRSSIIREKDESLNENVPPPASLRRAVAEAGGRELQTCDDVWSTNARGHTCGGRIEWVRDNQGKSLDAAKRQIANEFPDECGPCGRSSSSSGSRTGGSQPAASRSRPDPNPAGNAGGACGVVVPDPMNDSVTHDEQCGRYLGSVNAGQPCFFNGRRGEPCVLDYGNDVNPRWIDKNPNDCPGDTLYLWDEPWTDHEVMDPPQSTEQGAWAQAGRDWARYVQKWSSQLQEAKARGMKITSPQGKWGPISNYLNEFFRECNNNGGGCDDPNSPGYIDIIGINAFCGAWNTGCGPEGYCCEEAAQWSCNEIVNKNYGRPVYMTNWAALGLIGCRDMQYRAMQAVPILLDCPAIDRVYWYSAYMWDDTRFNCEEENYLDKRLSGTGTTLGEEWARICAPYNGGGSGGGNTGRAAPRPATRGATRPAPRPAPQPAPRSGGGETCDDVWNSDANGHTCGGRIEWVRDNQGKSLDAAKRQIANEFPAECGPCRAN